MLDREVAYPFDIYHINLMGHEINNVIQEFLRLHFDILQDIRIRQLKYTDFGIITKLQAPLVLSDFWQMVDVEIINCVWGVRNLVERMSRDDGVADAFANRAVEFALAEAADLTLMSCLFRLLLIKVVF